MCRFAQDLNRGTPWVAVIRPKVLGRTLLNAVKPTLTVSFSSSVSTTIELANPVALAMPLQA